MRGGSKKKYYVYVKIQKNDKVKKISFGDVHGGLTAKVVILRPESHHLQLDISDTKKKIKLLPVIGVELTNLTFIWVRHTLVIGKIIIIKKIMKLPFKEEIISDSIFIRDFEQDTDSGDYMAS
jgi:hypothetical protein